jgi:sucrose-6-phosphate hydrolase SacC (GH32 family)
MTIARKMGLLATEEGIRLVQSPMTALHPSRICRQTWQTIELEPGCNAIFPTDMPNCYEFDVSFKLGKRAKIAIEMRQSEDEKTVLTYDHKRKVITVDRTKSGEIDFHPEFGCAHEVAIPYVKNELRLQVIVDTCSIEVFIADGRDAITDLIFPKATSNGISMRLEEGNALIQTMKLYDYSK